METESAKLKREERNAYQREYQRKRRQSDPDYKAKQYASTRRSLNKRYQSDPEFRQKTKKYEKVSRLMKVIVALKSSKEWEPLGCTPQKFIDHLESQFMPDMNWGNYGKVWNIDHINPVCAGGEFHYKNLRPLHKHANQAKIPSDKKKSKRRGSGGPPPISAGELLGEPHPRPSLTGPRTHPLAGAQ